MNNNNRGTRNYNRRTNYYKNNKNKNRNNNNEDDGYWSSLAWQLGVQTFSFLTYVTKGIFSLLGEAIQLLWKSALSHDEYRQERTDARYQSKEAKEKKLKENSTRKASKSLERFKQGTAVNNLKAHKTNPRVTREINEYDIRPILMPTEFDFTTGIVTNLPLCGVRHSLLRHSDQWQQKISTLQSIWNRLSQLSFSRNSPVVKYANFGQLLKAIQEADTSDSSGKLLEDFLVALCSLNQYEEARSLFQKAETHVLNFIQRHATYAKYRGEGINNTGCEQVYFEVDTSNEPIMMLGISEDRFLPTSNFNPSGDQREVRLVNTVFFMSKWKMEKNWVSKRFTSRSIIGVIADLF